jgi:hypothetical protein
LAEDRILQRRDGNARLVAQPQRYVFHGADIDRHILADAPIPPCRGSHQHAALVSQRQRRTVDLEFANELARTLADSLAHAGEPHVQLIEIHGVVE